MKVMTILYVLFFASQTVTYAAFMGRPVRWQQALVYPVVDALCWALLAPAVWWLAARFPLERARLGRRILLHFGAACLAAVASSALTWTFPRAQACTRRSAGKSA